jgi:AbiU2
MPQHSQEVVKRFEQICIRMHQSWQIRKCLFDDKSNLAIFRQPHYEHFFLRLRIILQEYWTLQIAKLHDPVGKPGRYNLSIDYMIECGDWKDETKARLVELREKMLPFAETMKLPRNKLGAHNDVATILAEIDDMGAFDEGDDVQYFANLKAFAEIVIKAVVDEHFDYDNGVPTDVDLFVDAFNRGRIGGECAA